MIMPARKVFATAKKECIYLKNYANLEEHCPKHFNKYLYVLAQTPYKIAWKKKLGKEHNQIERTLFTALGYWKTDLTAFVNLWDTLDDRICSILAISHPELGGYQLGKIGSSINRDNRKFFKIQHFCDTLLSKMVRI